MKTEINNENKAKFFALYWGQFIGYGHAKRNGKLYVENNFLKGFGVETNYIELKNLSSITDEDLIHCYHLHSSLIGYDGTMDFKDTLTMAKHWIKMDGEKSLYKFTELSDFLRSKGYALPWMGLSVDEMIEAGWVKLKES